MRKREQDEPIASIADDLRLMAQRAYTNLGVQAQEALALNQLYKSISLEMKCRCMDRDCRSVAEAVDVIERYEAILEDPRDKKKSVRFTGPKEDRNQTSRGQLDEIMKQMKEISDRLSRLEQPQSQGRETDSKRSPQKNQRSSRRCFVCGSLDHFFRQCPEYSQMYHNYHGNSVPAQNSPGRYFQQERNQNQGDGRVEHWRPNNTFHLQSSSVTSQKNSGEMASENGRLSA